jgi:hypothetical protein
MSARAKIIVAVDLISDALPFGRLSCEGPNKASNAIDYTKFRRRSDKAVTRRWQGGESYFPC